MSVKKSGIAVSEDAYKKLSLKKEQIEAWEDGMRTTDENGTYEWWYFDAVMDDGAKLVIVFYTKKVKEGNVKAGFSPKVTMEYDTAEGRHYEETLDFDASALAASKEKCDVRIGENRFAGDLHIYQIRFRGMTLRADVTLTGNVPAWRPETGHIYFGDNDEKYFAWLPSVPEGSVEAEITLDGNRFNLTGSGYHDHNWGNVPMMSLMNHWYWGRAKIGPYQVISSYITGEKEYGYQTYPIFMIAKDGKILADDALHNLKFISGHTVHDAVTGKPIDGTLCYDYDDGTDHYKVTYTQNEMLVQERMIDGMPKGIVKLLAKLAGFDGAYHRIAGNAMIEKYEGGKATESFEEQAIWELMYFGKTPKA